MAARLPGTAGWSPAELAARYAEIGHALAGRGSLLETLDVLTGTAVRLVPGAEFAGITRVWPDHFDTLAPTAPVVRTVDRIQYELGSGPCVSAVRDGTVYRTGRLHWDTRWPEFGRRAHEAAGVQSMLSFRLFVDGPEEFKAALNLYALSPEAFDEDAEAIGLLLATHGALAIRAAAADDRAENLSVALSTNRRIGVAIGVLMATHKITEEQAFDLLRIASQSVNRKLRDIADDVTLTGAIPLPAPVGASVEASTRPPSAAAID